MITLLYRDSPFCRMVQHALDAKGLFYHVESCTLAREVGDKVPILRVDNRIFGFEQALAWIDRQPNYPLD